MKHINALLTALTFVGALLLTAFLMYGIVTDCPNTTGYNYCSEDERK